MTLLFSMAQAVACAEANSKLISPFVGRILDWFREKTGEEFEGDKDPGVLSVTEIYNYYKKFGYPTEVMAASFRNTNEIKELVGCDLMTIGPKFLEEMQNDFAEIPEKLNVETSRESDATRLDMNESTFRFLMNQDEMAHFKLAEGIRKFSNDVESLGNLLNEKLSKIS
jgi:transaldolase